MLFVLGVFKKCLAGTKTKDLLYCFYFTLKSWD